MTATVADRPPLLPDFGGCGAPAAAWLVRRRFAVKFEFAAAAAVQAGANQLIMQPANTAPLNGRVHHWQRPGTVTYQTGPQPASEAAAA